MRTTVPGDLLQGELMGLHARVAEAADPGQLGLEGLVADETRNTLVVRAAQAIIAIGGEYGTLSEIAFALRARIPVMGLGTWQLARDGHIETHFHQAADPAEAVRLALGSAGGNQPKKAT